MITQNNEMIQEIVNNLEVAEMFADSTDQNDRAVVQESIKEALFDLTQLAEVAAIPSSEVLC